MNLFKKQKEIENGIISYSQKHIHGTYAGHGHDFFEIEYILDGSGTYIVDGKAYPICKNMLFFISPSGFHEIRDCDAEIINVMFSCNICDTNALSRLFEPNIIPHTWFSDEDSLLITKLLQEILSAANTDYSIQFLKCILYKLSTMLPPKQHHRNTHIQNAIIYIHENFRTNLTLADTAKYLHLTPTYLSNLFLQETDMNFKAYLDNIRFDYVLKLLIFTDMKINEICMKSGFFDYANFMRRFKLRFDCTPTEYRKINSPEKI